MDKLRTKSPSLAVRQEMELESWRSYEGRTDQLGYSVAVLNKAPVLLDMLRRYADSFERANDILELGAGQGWASCIVKRRFPHARITASDMSPDAIAGITNWERVFDVQVDEKLVAPSYDTRRPDSSVDLVFAFASAHHFVLQRRTLEEIARVLRPGGQALYLYEPSCSDWIHPLAAARVRRTRSDVVEDTLKQGQIQDFARAAGLRPELHLYPSTRDRGPVGTIYNTVLLRVPKIGLVLWCGANFRFTKPATESADRVQSAAE